MGVTEITVPLYWSVQWQTTGLMAGDVVTAEFDGFGSLVDLEIRRNGVALDFESALDGGDELDALLDAGMTGQAEMRQWGDES